MREHEKELLKSNVKVAVVTFEADIFAKAYIEETSLSWPLLVDADRKLYMHYEMLSASFWDIWGPGTLWTYLKEIMRGHKPKKSKGNIYQRGGDVLIDPDGIVRLHHVGKTPSDRPSIETILNTMQQEQDTLKYE